MSNDRQFPFLDADSTRRTVSSVDALMDIVGATSDAADSHTDATAISAMKVWKQISASVQSLVTGAVLAAGSALVGNVGIDQTTPGTTDSVTVATEQGAGAAIGATTGAAVITDANGTVQQYLRGLVKLWIGGLAAGANLIGAVKTDIPNWTTSWGVTAAPVNSADMSSVADVTDAPTTGQKIVVDSIIVSWGGVAGSTITFKCATSGAVISGPHYMAANSTFPVPLSVAGSTKGPKLATADKKLQAVCSVSGAVTVNVGYHSEA